MAARHVRKVDVGDEEHGIDLDTGGYVQSVSLLRERVKKPASYPFSIQAIKKMGTLVLDPKVTFFVGENGSGKSTLIEGIAVAAGFNAEGGSKNFDFATSSPTPASRASNTKIRNTTRSLAAFSAAAKPSSNSSSPTPRSRRQVFR